MSTVGEQDLDVELDGLTRTIVTMARTLRVKDARLEPTLEAIAAVAAEATGFEAGLLLVEEGTLVPRAATAPAPRELDLVQAKLGDGPCLLAARDQQIVVLADADRDSRWPEFCLAARERSVLSMVCAPLRIDDRCLGALSLYAATPRAFARSDEAVAELCAALAATALADAHRAEQLRRALHSRDLIGQAKGVLMERHKLTADQAFDLLSRVSQQRNRKLVVVASHLLETGELLGGAPA